MAKTRGGLTKWFKEDWRDVKTGKKCGRSGPKDKRKSYPACRPKSQASSAMAKKMAKKLVAKHLAKTFWLKKLV